MATRMQQRRGTAAQWVSTNSGNGPILGAGEVGWESDTNKFKIGDGINHWADLAYFVDQDTLGTSLNGYLEDSLLGAANGVAQLNSSGKLVSDQIPNIDEITQDAIDSALVGGDGITKTYNDNANTITIDVDITSGDGLKIASNKLTVDDTVVQKRVANVTDVEIGYLDGVTSSIQTQLNNKLASADLTEAAQDAVNTAIVAGTGLDKTYDDTANTITLDIDSTVATLTGTQTFTNKTLTSPVINTPTGITKSDVGLANVDNTTDANKPVSTATQTSLDLKAPIASPTFTGTVTLPANTITNVMISDNAVDTAEIKDSAVTSAKIADGAIVNGDINASAAIALSKLATDPLARANHTGTQTASTISNFDTQVRTSKVTDLTAPTGSFSMNSQKITNLLDPTADQDAATKSYVDAATAGLNVHASVKAATTVAIGTTYNNGTSGVGATIAPAGNGALTLDGVSLSVGNRVLIKNQSSSLQNGVYIVTTAGSAGSSWLLTRASDYDTVPEVDAGDFIYVESGTSNGTTGWVQTSTVTTIGTDSITFTQFSGAGTYLAGTGLTLTGSTFSIGSEAITSTMIADGTIVNADINASAAIALSKLATDPLARSNHTGSQTASTISDFNEAAQDAVGGILGSGLTYTDASNTITVDSSVIQLRVTGVSDTEIGYLDGVTSSIQTQLDAKSTASKTETLTNKTLTSPVINSPTGITKSDISLANVENTAISTWAGSTNITTLGTIATGTWSATTIALNKGGTGATTQAGAANAVLPSQASANGKYLTSDGTNVSWGTVSGYSAPTLGSTSIGSGATVTTITGLTENNLTLTGSLTAGGSAGTNGYVLTSTGSGVQWAASSGGSSGANELMVIMGAY